jgi:hypothetical protein
MRVMLLLLGQRTPQIGFALDLEERQELEVTW